MNDDYLWDGSGEPDAEVAEFEELFRELRFDRNTAKLPVFAQALSPAHRKFSLPLAIAASLIFVLFAGALAVKLGSRFLKRGQTIVATHPSEAVPNGEGHDIGLPTESELAPGRSPEPERVKQQSPTKGLRYASSKKSRSKSNSELARIREGEHAKEELMSALRIASAKLNLVQQKLAVNKEVRPSS